MLVKCKFCSCSWSENNPTKLKGELRHHREEHKDVFTSVNECFR